ncbi:M48 family metallopeptidase [Glacieibacterium frigidum]|uniref:M48 family metallopeptidase n=1 Tax=Glacieibacterium frigidum TaxID=2593303 RepID=A0A552UGE3_9SPHN|nr:M48 family metallopeptidase [Glacieibacterium frigidum]TRW17261.1 M48 family metallopeptidase [Glacieibacterium frigidum]
MAIAQAAFDVEAATRAYLATVSGAARIRSDAYFEGGYWLTLWGALISIGVAYLFLRMGWAARLSAWAQRQTGGRMFLATALFLLVFSLLTAVIELPWQAYTGYFREHQYGMSNQTLGEWLVEMLKGAAISLPITALAIAALFIGVRRSPKRWWAYGAAGTAVVMSFFIAAGPVFIEPLFNTYKPMPASPLQAQILSMARANGVPAHDVLVVDASKQTKRISANVAGLGPTTRVALNDNLLATKDDAGTLSVMGHELGHYVLGHVVVLILSFVVLITLAFLVVSVAVPALIRRNPAWGIKDIGDPGAFAVWSIVFSVFFLLLTPVTNSLIRFNEHQADIFGLNAARAPDGFARSALRLGAYRKLEPGPIEEAIFYDHPSGATRIRMAMQWKSEHLNEPGVR